jgi:hypothetical protein
VVETVVVKGSESGPTDPNANGNTNVDTTANGNSNANVTLPSEGGDKGTGNEPGKLAGKFDSPADLEKAYLELQTKLGGGDKGKGTEPPKPNANDPKIPDQADVDAAKGAVEKAGLNFDELSGEYAKDGKLTDASYEKLEKGGIPRAMVDAFINGQIALANQQAAALTSAAHEAAGGAEKYGQVVEWAKDNLSKEDIQAFNKVIETGDHAQVKLAVAGLNASFVKAGGAEPSNIKPGSNGGPSQYGSVAEVMKDMGDPRYQSDPAFRAAVEQKVARSTVL